MKNHRKQPGYILVFSLMFIALVMMLSTIISNRARLHVGYSKTMLDKERAKILALSGLEIAKVQLAIVQKSEDTLREDAKAPPQGDRGGAGLSELWTEKEAKEFIKNVYPYLNNWQEFNLTEKNFGVNGEIKISIGVEGGKIDLNQIFDFKNKKFVGQKKGSKKTTQNKKEKDNKSKGAKETKESESSGDFKKVFDELFKSMGKFVKVKELQKKIEGYLTKKQQFEKILKNRQNKLYDLTEFCAIKEFDVFQDKVFYEPSVGSMERGKVVNKQKPTIFWTDIFTIWSGVKKINPWFISPSMQRILKFKKSPSVEAIKKRAEKIAKKFKKNLSFPSDWKEIFEPLFGVKYDNLPKWIKPLMSKKFEPKVFSVLSSGKVGKVSQKIFAIIERKKVKKKEKIVVEFDIKKLYWL